MVSILFRNFLIRSAETVNEGIIQRDATISPEKFPLLLKVEKANPQSRSANHGKLSITFVKG